MRTMRKAITRNCAIVIAIAAMAAVSARENGRAKKDRYPSPVAEQLQLIFRSSLLPGRSASKISFRTLFVRREHLCAEMSPAHSGKDQPQELRKEPALPQPHGIGDLRERSGAIVRRPAERFCAIAQLSSPKRPRVRVGAAGNHRDDLRHSEFGAFSIAHSMRSNLKIASRRVTLAEPDSRESPLPNSNSTLPSRDA